MCGGRRPPPGLQKQGAVKGLDERGRARGASFQSADEPPEPHGNFFRQFTKSSDPQAGCRDSWRRRVYRYIHARASILYFHPQGSPGRRRDPEPDPLHPCRPLQAPCRRRLQHTCRWVCASRRSWRPSSARKWTPPAPSSSRCRSCSPPSSGMESGRWNKYGAELLRFKDRHQRDFVIQPTSEEVITDLARQRAHELAPAAGELLSDPARSSATSAARASASCAPANS